MEQLIWFRSSVDGNTTLVLVLNLLDCQFGPGLQFKELPNWFRSSIDGIAKLVQIFNSQTANLVQVFT